MNLFKVLAKIRKYFMPEYGKPIGGDADGLRNNEIDAEFPLAPIERTGSGIIIPDDDDCDYYGIGFSMGRRNKNKGDTIFKYTPPPGHALECSWEKHFWDQNRKCDCGLHNYKDSIRLWVDDSRKKPDDYDVHVFSAIEAVHILLRGTVSHVSLDYNLLGFQKSGDDILTAVCTLIQEGHNIPVFTWSIHCGMFDNAEKMRKIMQTINSLWCVENPEIETKDTPTYTPPSKFRESYSNSYKGETVEEWLARNRREDREKEERLAKFRNEAAKVDRSSAIGAAWRRHKEKQQRRGNS
jgi:hypothetical protein